MIRRRPIQRSSYHWHPEPKGPSLRYQLVLNGAVRVYKDSAGNVVREVCQDSPKGWLEYHRRVGEMVQRQNFRCCLCGERISVSDATFDHQRRRGMGAAFRDDRLENGKAAHWICNVEKG
jgi:hypothetical protein